MRFTPALNQGSPGMLSIIFLALLCALPTAVNCAEPDTTLDINFEATFTATDTPIEGEYTPYHVEAIRKGSRRPICSGDCKYYELESGWEIWCYDRKRKLIVALFVNNSGNASALVVEDENGNNQQDPGETCYAVDGTYNKNTKTVTGKFGSLTLKIKLTGLHP